jgi:hypothetical protein
MPVLILGQQQTSHLEPNQETIRVLSSDIELAQQLTLVNPGMLANPLVDRSQVMLSAKPSGLSDYGDPPLQRACKNKSGAAG